MVSDQEIASCVESLLRGSVGAGEAASLAAVLQRAQAQLGVDLSHKAPYIRDQMDLFFGPRLHPTPPTPMPAPTPKAPTPPSSMPQQPPPQQQQVQLQLPLEMQQQQFAAIQPQYIFQTMPPQQLPPAVSSAANAPPVPAMAFYPPPPLAFRYANALGGVATGGTLSFQQPAPGVGVAGMASPTAAAAPPPAAADNKESAKRKRGGPGGLNKVCAISPELQAVVGETAMSRTQIVKQLWAYIRQNNLQDPDDKRKIICNDELRIVFETDATDMFKMNKLLAKHITPLDPKDQLKEAKKLKSPNPAPQQMPPINQPYLVVSDALAKFIGVEGTVPHEDALKYLWDYIKANQLEDAPSASILCDSQLQELFGCESIPASQLSELLAHHFIHRT